MNAIACNNMGEGFSVDLIFLLRIHSINHLFIRKIQCRHVIVLLQRTSWIPPLLTRPPASQCLMEILHLRRKTLPTRPSVLWTACSATSTFAASWDRRSMFCWQAPSPRSQQRSSWETRLGDDVILSTHAWQEADEKEPYKHKYSSRQVLIALDAQLELVVVTGEPIDDTQRKCLQP